jgi:hypothetical protein
MKKNNHKMEITMSVFRYLLPTVAATVMVSSSMGFAQTPELERDSKALREYTKTKRAISVRDKGGDLSLSGDVRFEYQNVTESTNGTSNRGSGTGKANHMFDVEANLALDYKADDTWAAINLRFDNDAGAYVRDNKETVGGSGTGDKLWLKRAYAGYNLFQVDAAKFDVEIGRHQLYDVFSSCTQFNSQMDGVAFKYANSLESVGDFTTNAGVWIVDDVVDHYAWAIQMGLMDITDTGLFAKFSYVHWDKSGVNRFGVKTGQGGYGREYQSRNSELIVGYKFQPEVLRTDLCLYSSYLVNHASKKLHKVDNKRHNKAWVVGATFGKIEYAGDWSVDMTYQHCGAQSVISQDVAGIGNGNVKKNHEATTHDNSTTKETRGNANFKGYAIEATFALTDNFNVSMEYESSNAASKAVGGRQSYHKLEIETVYSF